MPTEFLPGNRLRLLESGKDYFPALLAAIAGAQREIWLETYIFADDPIGQTVAEALCVAARRGVVVRVLVDGFGARNFRTDFAEALTQARVQTMEYRPELGRTFKRHRLRRLHRKLVLIDHTRAFVGGINITDDNNAPPGLAPRYDYAVQIEGPVVGDIRQAMRHMWEIVSWANLKHRFRFRRDRHPRPPALGDQAAAFLIRDNIRHRLDIANAYLEAIHAARQEIFIASAYFLPGFRFRHALKAAAQRGVQVTLLLQGQSDHPLLHYATQALYGSLLADGIRLYEYRQSFLHAKAAVIDTHWATVGSSNIDPFSLVLAKEGNLFVQDRGFAGDLLDKLQTAARDGAVELRTEDIQRLSWLARSWRWLCYAAVRAAMGFAGYAERHRAQG